MPDAPGIVDVDRMDGDVVLVVFSDGTTGRYDAEELLALKPDREVPESD